MVVHGRQCEKFVNRTREQIVDVSALQLQDEIVEETLVTPQGTLHSALLSEFMFAQ